MELTGIFADKVETAVHTPDDGDVGVILVLGHAGTEYPLIAKLDREDVDDLIHNLKHCRRHLYSKGLVRWFQERWEALVDAQTAE